MKAKDIKFRGKVKDSDEWIFGDLIHHKDGTIHIGTIPSIREVDPKTIGQKLNIDYNCNDIYHGDILHLINKYEDVEYNAKVDGDGYVEFSYGEYDYYPVRNLDEYEVEYRVVGNIWDNPELLKQE